MSTEPNFEAAITRMLREEVGRVAEEETEAAIKRVRERLRLSLAGIVASVHQQYSMERMGSDIIIRVKIEEPKK